MLQSALSYVQPLGISMQGLIVLFSQDLRWQWHFVQQGGTFTHRRPSYHWGIMDHHSFFRSGTILRIRVSNCYSTWGA